MKLSFWYFFLIKIGFFYLNPSCSLTHKTILSVTIPQFLVNTSKFHNDSTFETHCIPY